MHTELYSLNKEMDTWNSMSIGAINNFEGYIYLLNSIMSLYTAHKVERPLLLVPVC